MKPGWDANGSLKHNKPQFSLGKTEVRSRSGCQVPCLPGSKIHPLCPLLAQNSVAKRSIPATWRPKSCRYSIHPSIVSPPTLCIGAPVSHYVMGGGWELCTQSVIVNASAMTATAEDN